MNHERMLREVQAMRQAIKDADTPENEAQLRARLAESRTEPVRMRGKNPGQCGVVVKNGVIEGVNHHDVSQMVANINVELTSRAQPAVHSEGCR